MRRCGLVLSALLLVGCARLGIDASSGPTSASASASPTAGAVSPEPTNASSPPGVPRDCGELAADPCRTALDEALRLVPPGEELISAAITPLHGEVPDLCDECPPWPADWLTGAELRLADRSPLELNCLRSFVVNRSEEELLAADDWTVFEDDTTEFCWPVDEAERRYGTLAYREVDDSSERLHSGPRSVLGAGGMGVIGGCAHYKLGVPFSFYIARVDDHGHYAGRGWREVFRSEDFGNRSGHFSFLITVHSFDDVTVEEVDPC